ncbi:MAG: methionyl-tRNA formyltransferase [candidate division Zixibacteria bacterium]|nr:methionyl-tRNA formyltransferase [candidate division Zixibacteria bacterium]NIR63245.1 methionyl-tRNA formyltransferase [candidate division Zixibacteria bacterium]NIS17105.1 methionyl-tRNA formyltransferase [candidate division Zixibacteria bacterium]NIS45226.1 methionyl-tRNA formyltransferase [candidate division Zixibacteria bacterium]NIU13362.1 methionyl-tRNA formyltransferase [candidate division Zixibacteria bacterium]
MGNPQFAVPALEKLLSSRHEVAAVVTSPDRPKGRGKKPASPAVAEKAREKGLTLIQQENLSEQSFLAKITALAVTIFVVVAFRILPAELFSIPPRGAINLHASLLPKYRGAAPIQWAIINGERETGLTTFSIQKKVDTGGIILQEKVPIGPMETADDLSARMSVLGADLILQTLDLIESGDYEIIPQDNSQASKAPKIKPSDGHVDWSLPAEKIVNLIRGLSSNPGAYTHFDGKKLKLYRARLVEAENSRKPGEIITANDREGLVIKTGKDAVLIDEIQMEGKKRLPCCDYMRGCPIKEGHFLT